jgi:hypothetical protein
VNKGGKGNEGEQARLAGFQRLPFFFWNPALSEPGYLIFNAV